jgi:hypothetical protein
MNGANHSNSLQKTKTQDIEKQEKRMKVRYAIGGGITGIIVQLLVNSILKQPYGRCTNCLFEIVSLFFPHLSIQNPSLCLFRKNVKNRIF